MVTKDVNSLTNSCIMALDKEFRKNGVAPGFHNDFNKYRDIVKSLVEAAVLNEG